MSFFLKIFFSLVDFIIFEITELAVKENIYKHYSITHGQEIQQYKESRIIPE